MLPPDELTPALVEKARVELNETPERRVEALAELVSQIEASEEVTCDTAEIFLLPFLRVAKFDTAKAWNRLKKFCTFRTKHADLFGAKADDLVAQHAVGMQVRKSISLALFSRRRASDLHTCNRRPFCQAATRAASWS
jgi:hypothetical protein